MDLAVVVIHGIGSQTEAFAAPLVAELTRRLEARGHDPGRVAWQPILWADLLAPRQAEYLRRAGEDGPLDWFKLREVVVSALGDAAAYQYVDRPSATYAAIHDRLRQRMRHLYVEELASTPVPLVVLAHSLGSHIMSSYIWDTQHEKATGAGDDASAFERFEHLAGMITFGSNIPLFTFAYDPILPIAFPGTALSPAVAELARWDNYYDRDDVLGYPLRPTSPQYAQVVDADVEIDVGAIGLSSTPLSHNAYWSDASFLRPVAETLGRLLET